MRETLRFSGKILSATVFRTADQWFASITVDTDSNRLPPAENQGDALSLSKGVVGVDLGISALATLSTGEIMAGAKPHKTLLSRLQRLFSAATGVQSGNAWQCRGGRGQILCQQQNLFRLRSQDRKTLTVHQTMGLSDL